MKNMVHNAYWFMALLILTVLLLPFCTFAAEIAVEPGTNTLQTAVTDAEDGDILILRNGVYIISQATTTRYNIGKSLTIKSQSKIADPVITMLVHGNPSGTINVTGCVLQGITIRVQLAGFGYKVIECDCSLSYGSDSILVGSNVILIGNHFQRAASRPGGYIGLSGADNIVAGNHFTDVNMSSSTPSWVVGNTFEQTTQNASRTISIGGNGFSVVAGNRITVNNTSVISVQPIYVSGSPEALVAGNLIALNVSNSCRNYGIKVYATGRVDIVNNVIYRSGQADTDTHAAIVNPGMGTIAGNIIVGHNYAVMIAAPYARVTNNICHSNQAACGSQSGIVVTDPQFQDLVDFRLAAGSPGIDAGSVDYAYSDLDRSRNDIGIYGGPWSIEQYDTQRDPNRSSPFVYPLFQPPLTAWQGQLPVRAVGVARLR